MQSSRHRKASFLMREWTVGSRGAKGRGMDAHIVCAVKLAMFALVGLGWLSLREYMGALPWRGFSNYVVDSVISVTDVTH